VVVAATGLVMTVRDLLPTGQMAWPAATAGIVPLQASTA
jgi:hypothetical protein